MNAFHTLVTHPGGAHKDEILACSVLLATRAVPIVRREPKPDDLSDPLICVIDVGHRHEPALNNFDHHQFPKDAPPTCSLSLVLKHLGLYEAAREFCEWLEPTEWFDARGPFATADWLGVDRDILARLNSPIDVTLLKRFSEVTTLRPGDPLWEFLRLIGEDLLTYIKGLSERLTHLQKTAEFWELASINGKTVQALFLPRSDPSLEDASMGFDRFIERSGRTALVAALVYPDRRGGGYGLSRFRDDARMDFTRIASYPDVHFTHARGFVAKTSASLPARLRELLEASRVPDGSSDSTL